MALTLFTDGSLSVADKLPSGSGAAYQRQSAQLFETGSSKCSSNRDDRSRSRSPVRSNKMYTIEAQIGPTSSRSSGKGVGQSKWHRRPLRVIATLTKLSRTTNGSSLSKARKLKVPASFEPWQAGTLARGVWSI